MLKKTRSLMLLIAASPLFLAANALADTACSASSYWIGAGQEDITGPVAEVGMMGYADLKQVDEGLHMRLRARAMVISDSCRQSTVAMVIADLGQVFGGMREEVLKRLEAQRPGVFTRENLMISATHTHSGPGGFAHHALYNITSLGFNSQNFEAIVSGITDAILKAERLQKPGELSVSSGDIAGLQWNRSLEAFVKNPAEERAQYGDKDADQAMTLLKAVHADGRPQASFNWFPVHGVSIPMSNKLVSGDNKGMAAYIVEKNMGARYQASEEYVAGFVQSNSGDISPYDFSLEAEKTSDGWARNLHSGEVQANMAQHLMNEAGEALSGPVGAVHKMVKLAYRPVDAAFTKAGPQTTCNAVLGVGFAAGTENGNPVGIFHQGTVYGVNWAEITLMPDEQACHKEKVLLLPTGFVKPDPWTAPVAPFQIFRIGQLAVVGAPFEMTTMAGRRLRAAVLEEMAPLGVTHVVLSGLANEYLHYVSTREEYAAQHYEGGSNLYGPWSLAAYTQIFAELSHDMIAGRKPVDEAQPLDLSGKQVTLKPGVVWDTAPLRKKFGDVKTEPMGVYQRSHTATVEFWGAHPNNSRRGSYLRVEERMLDGSWKIVRQDWDSDTRFYWKREGLANSVTRVEWDIGLDVPAGSYRICQSGHSKALLSGKLTAYEGCSSSFEVQ